MLWEQEGQGAAAELLAGNLCWLGMKESMTGKIPSCRTAEHPVASTEI